MDKKKISLVSLGHLSCDVNGGALPAILPFLRTHYGLTYQATGGLMFAYSCLSSIIQPLFGLMADRLSKPWLIPLGVFLAGMGLAAVGFMSSYWAIFAAIGLSGVGAALFHPEGARFANKVSGKSKGTGMSIFSIGGNAGFVIGPLLATFFLSWLGMPGTFIFGLLATVMASILLLLIMRMVAPEAAAAAQRTAEAAYGTQQAGAQGKGVQARRGGMPVADAGTEEAPQNNWHEFSKLTGAIIARSVLFVGFNTFIPLYWVNGFGQSKTAGAIALTIFCTFGVASNILGGVLADRHGFRAIVRMGFALMTPAVLAFGLLPNLYAAYALLPLLGFVLYAPFSSLVVLGQTYLARNIGFASGVTLGLATSLGGVFAPLLGWIADNHGLPRTFQCLAVVAFIGTVFAFALREYTAKTPARA
ncbi:MULTISPECIES: MFS transporter [Desulfovibrio]|uniref:MFS transporter, FSR family, fosmidomycin resistance protein n=1 Tax=Desulfovibrio desulfuricans TaxID=876 RepID=A0AA94L2P5_DESDE|nr:MULTISPECIES: MFS transporter [Desulfovibrio]ATD82592.1 MFS transporter [Desulfovibrio sp. G11]MDY0203368.1 MFS transporter [Desulfovibrio desulfuricans]SFW56497.1 MFS transporter, FSR family, fosmidomycin resistance protein [Desulfovibrio desulfuricans]SPD35393.1 Major facilitator superfamily transporter [Desulfovibrio sp. G11]